VEGFNEMMKKPIENGFKQIEGFPQKGVYGRIAFFIPPPFIGGENRDLGGRRRNE
jgi:hypothetical protein